MSWLVSSLASIDSYSFREFHNPGQDGWVKRIYLQKGWFLYFIGMIRLFIYTVFTQKFDQCINFGKFLSRYTCRRPLDLPT